MAEPTLDALKQFLIENGCKVKTSDAIEFYRANYAEKAGDHGRNKELFKKHMDTISTAHVTESGERYLVLKRQHMVFVNSPYSPRSRRTVSTPKSLHASPCVSPRSDKRAMTLNSKSPPSPYLDPHVGYHELDESSKSPSVYDSDEFSEDDFDDMELGSVGGCSNHQLEPCQKEWMYKTATGDIDSISRLLLQDSENTLIKYKDFISGYTGLHWACKLGRPDIVKVLVTCGAEVNAKAYNGMTPLHVAAQCGFERIVDTLLDNKADKFIRDHNGKHPVFYLPPHTDPRIKDILTPPSTVQPKPRISQSLEHSHHHSSSKEKNFSLRRHKREKSDSSRNGGNFKYHNLKDSSRNRRSLSNIKIEHIGINPDGSEGVTMVRSKEEAFECFSNTTSPRSVKRISLNTPLNSVWDGEPLLQMEEKIRSNKSLTFHPSTKEVPEEPLFIGTDSHKTKSSFLCCCPKRPSGPKKRRLSR